MEYIINVLSRTVVRKLAKALRMLIQWVGLLIEALPPLIEKITEFLEQ